MEGRRLVLVKPLTEKNYERERERRDGSPYKQIPQVVEFAVGGILDLNEAPAVLPAQHQAAHHVVHLLAAHHGKRGHLLSRTKEVEPGKTRFFFVLSCC